MKSDFFNHCLIIYCENDLTTFAKYEALFNKLYEAMNGGKLDKARAASAVKYLLNFADCGRWGRAEEVLQARKRQKKVWASPGNKKDNTLTFINSNGRREYRNAESKENGGRITDLLTPNGWTQGEAPKYIIYTLRIAEPITAKKKAALKAEGKPLPMRIVKPKVIPVDVFVAKVFALGAYKDATDAEGNVNGIQIQPTNKAFYEWLERWPVEYNREWTYEDWEFNGAE